MGTGAFAEPPIENSDYKKGYLCGIIRGDGHLASYEYERIGRIHGNQHQFRLALADEEALHRADEYLSAFEVTTHDFVFQRAIAGRRGIRAIRTGAQAKVDRVRDLIAWPPAPSDSWNKGFLAGIFDAEGGYTGALRSMRAGRLNDPDFGTRMKGEGVYAEHIARLFDISCRRAGIEHGRFPRLSTDAFRGDGGVQPVLFD